MFLAVQKNLVIDTPAAAEVAAVLDADGVTELQPAVPAVAEVSHFEEGRMYLDNDVPRIIQQIEDGGHIDYYSITLNGPGVAPTLSPVAIKAGPRAAAPVRETVELEAGGATVGKHDRDA